MDPDYAHIRYEWNQRCLDGRQRLLTVDLGARSGKRIEERIWWMFLIYWAIWTLIRQNYFRMLSAGTSQDVGLPPCPNLPAPMLARVRWIYMQNIQMCIPWTHLCSTTKKKKQPEHMQYTHWLKHCDIYSLSSLFVILCFQRKLLFLIQSFVWLDAAAWADAVFSFRQVCTFLCTRVCTKEREREKCSKKHAYIFNLAQVYTVEFGC